MRAHRRRSGNLEGRAICIEHQSHVDGLDVGFPWDEDTGVAHTVTDRSTDAELRLVWFSLIEAVANEQFVREFYVRMSERHQRALAAAQDLALTTFRTDKDAFHARLREHHELLESGRRIVHAFLLSDLVGKDDLAEMAAIIIAIFGDVSVLR